MNGHHPVAIPVLGVTALVTAMALTPTDIAQIIGALAIFVTALGGAVAAIISALGKRIKQVQTEIVDVKTEMADVKTGVAETKTKVEIVEKLANGSNTKLELTNEALRKHIALLEEDRAEKRQVAAVLQAGATPVMAADAPARSLQQIDKNTADTATNTKRTEEKVNALDDHTKE